MPEIVTGDAEWRDTLVGEMELLEVPAFVHQHGGLPAKFRRAKTSTALRADVQSYGHLLFTINVTEGDFIGYHGGASVTTGYEQHEWFADVQFTYELRPKERQEDEDRCRALARWLLHSLTPGALSIGGARKLDDATQFEAIRPGGKGLEWMLVTLSIRADVYVSRSLAVVPV